VVRVPCKLYILEGGDEVYYVLLSLIANTVIRILGFGGELLQVIFFDSDGLLYGERHAEELAG
jgi:hypothetical protein